MEKQAEQVAPSVGEPTAKSEVRSEERRPEDSGREDNSPPLSFIPFSSPRRPKDETQDRPKRKEINLGELKKAIEDSLDKKTPPSRPVKDEEKSGTIEPGQTVRF